MIADLHAHYAMHLRPRAPGSLFKLLFSKRGRARLRDRLRALLIGFASRFANYRSFGSGERVTVPRLQDGHVRIVLSVLYSFFDELDLEEPYGAPPQPGYLETLRRQLETVREDVDEEHGQDAQIARSPAGLDAALDARKIAFVHCVEGGFHLGATPDEVERAVKTLAADGVAYVTLAHLLWRRVATNAPALPFLSERCYDRLFPQPEDGLSELGEAAVRAMHRHGVLIDVAHMSEPALDETLDLLDDLDPDKKVPVLASHSGYRFGTQRYNLPLKSVKRIAARKGVVGLIFAQHQLNDGIRKRRTRKFEDSFAVIRTHLDRIAAVTGSHEHTAIGSDFDGFIKPTLGGLEHMGHMRQLEDALRSDYDWDDAEAIMSGNALRVLRTGWRGAS